MTLFDNRYELVGKLGEGGMAEVYQVLDTTRGNRTLAYKLLKGRREHLEHFRHEFRVLSRLRHPNLIRVHDFGLTDDGRAVYYTAEYVDGDDLFTATVGLDYDRLFDVVVQIARGLSYIHARGLIHYDIKPENILVRRLAPNADGSPVWPADGAGEPPSDLVKIMDFGLTGEEDTRNENRIKGTVHYLAPEIARGAPHDRRVDLYSLGITLYHCLARRLPYDGGSTFSVIRKHLEKIPEPPRTFNVEVPAAWEEFVLRLLSKEPSDRPPSAADALADLGDRLGRSPVLDTKEALEGYLLSARFVGRDREIARLTSVISGLAPPAPVEPGSDAGGPAFVRPSTATGARSAAAPEQATVFVVRGEGGAGKTRLVQEVRVAAQLRGVPFVLAECLEGGPPLAPFARIVHSVAALAARPTPRAAGGGDEARRGPGAPDLDRLLVDEPALATLLGVDVGAGGPGAAPPDVASTGSPAGEDLAAWSVVDRDRALDRLAEALVRTAARTPYVLTVEDIHHADITTARMLEALARNLDYVRAEATTEPPRLVLLLTVRHELVDAGNPAAALLHLAAELPFVAEVPLGGLDATAQRDLVASMLALRDVPTRLADEIRDRAGGNPRFVTEILRALIEENAVALRHGPTERLPAVLADLGAPQSLAAVVSHRLERLGSREERLVLETLAIAFSPVPLDALGEATALSAEALLDILERHERAGLVVQGRSTTRERNPPIHYTLAHRTLRDGVLAGLGAARRAELHGRVGIAVEALARRRARPGSRYPVDAALLADLARHFEAAGDDARTFVYAVASSDHAARIYASDEAIGGLHRALRAAARDPDAPAEIVWDGERATTFSRGPLDSSSDERPSLLGERSAGDSDTWLQAEWTRDPDAPGGGSPARVVPCLRDREPACRLRLGELLGKVGRAAEAEQILGPLAVAPDRRLPRFSEPDRPIPTGFELHDGPISDHDDGEGSDDGDRPGSDETSARSESATHLAPRALRALGDVRQRLGRLAAALEAYEASLDACDRTAGGSRKRAPSGKSPMVRERIRSLVAIARVHLWRGDYARAVTLAEEARALVGPQFKTRETVRVLGVLALAEYHRGRHGRAQKLLRQCIRALRNDEREARRFLRRLALPSVSEESFTKSLRYLEGRPQLLRAVGDSYGITIAFTELGFLFDLRGTLDDVQEHYERSLGIYERLDDTEGIALSLNNLGVAARIRGDYGAALAQLQRALAIEREAGDRHGEAATLHNLGAVRLAAQDARPARELLSECLESCRALGIRWMAGYAQKALAAAEHALGRGRRARELLRRAEGLFRQIGNRRALADVILDRALLAIDGERVSEAKRALASARSSGGEETAPDFLAVAELVEGRIALAEGEIPRAVGHLDGALSYAVSTGLRELEARVEAQLGLAHETASRLRMATTHYDRATEIERTTWETLSPELRETYFRSPERERLRIARKRVEERLLEDDF